MKNIYECSKDVWDTFSESEKALWNSLVVDLSITTYMPNGVCLARGHGRQIAKNIATRVILAIRNNKETVRDILSGVRP